MKIYELTIGNITDESRKQEIYEEVKADLVVKYANEIPKSLNSIEDSLRISILDYENLTHNNYTIIDPKKSEDPVVFGGRLSTSIRKDYFDYYSDYPYLKETLFGEYTFKDPENDVLPYLPPATEDLPAVGEHTCFNAGTRKGVCPLDTNHLEDVITFATEQSISPEIADVSKHPENEDEGFLILLEPYKPHPITLSVYLEGWDRDNVDATQEAAFDIFDSVPNNINIELYKPFINPYALYKLKDDIQNCPAFGIKDDLEHLMSIYDTRQVTTIFIRVSTLKFKSMESLEIAQETMVIVQKNVSRKMAYFCFGNTIFIIYFCFDFFQLLGFFIKVIDYRLNIIQIHICRQFKADCCRLFKLTFNRKIKRITKITGNRFRQIGIICIFFNT